jgi:Undecaprenyl-phosphate galactose phosphotransferase WbaP
VLLVADSLSYTDMSAAAAKPLLAAPKIWPQVYHRPWAMAAALVIADLCTLSVAVAAGFGAWALVNPLIPPMNNAMLLAPASTIAALAFSGLYPGIGLTAVQHIRRCWRSITLVYLLLTATMFVTRSSVADSRGAFLFSWAFSLILVPLSRWCCGSFLGGRSWWGVPVMVIGAGSTGRAVIRNLKANKILGYRPVACLEDDLHKHGSCEGVPVVGTLSDAKFVAKTYGAQYAIVAIPGMPRERLIWNLRTWSRIFPNIMIVPNLAGVASLWTEPRDLGGVLGLEIRHNLLNPINQRTKRALDIAVSALGLIAVAPLLALCALWIKRVSPSNPFYRQEREGKDGRTLRVLKLRTMYPKADLMLEEHLAADPHAREEWNRFCKLKKDPRILPGVGNFLRKTSLDELPQLWNVLKGEMSLVGPRPFPSYHNRRFDPDFHSLRVQVTPGLTGLWQVSARSDGDLNVQASLDGYYIRNWSLWLDLYILIRTVRTVLAQEGSY